MKMYSLILILFLLPLILWKLFEFRTRLPNLPPGPFPFPIIGNILQLRPNPLHSLTSLSETYGPIMYLKLGTIQTIVISSPEMAKQILQKHDDVCSGRLPPSALHALDRHESIGWLPVGPKWNMLRKICKEHMFSTHKLDGTHGIRYEQVRRLRDYLDDMSSLSSSVDIGEAAFVTALNIISATFFSVEFARFDSTSDHQELIKELVVNIVKTSGTPNVADYFPIFKLIDPHGLKRKLGFYCGKMFEIFDRIISEKLQQGADSQKEKDLLDVLLALNQQNASALSHNDIKHLLLSLLLAGAHTTSYSVQWAMAELLHNPEKLSNAKREVETIIGKKKEQVEESDIPRLPYLNAVIKESLRRHPAAPFLVPHYAEADVEINGYTIPKGAQILVNEWAIGRDPTIWSDPDLFQPERFLGTKIDYKGHDFELIPFGSGRRMCPGLPMAHLMVHVMVASFIHSFDWKFEGQKLDMAQEFGLLFHKQPLLKAIPIKNCP